MDGALVKNGRRRRAPHAGKRREKSGHVATNGAARRRHSTYGTDATLLACGCPRHAHPEKVRRLLWGASYPTPPVIPDGRRRSSWNVRRAVLTDGREGRHGAFHHDALASTRVHPEATVLLPGQRSFSARERVLVNSMRVGRSEEIFGLWGLDERADSMRSRASLPFGPPLSFEQWSAFVNARRTRLPHLDLATDDGVTRCGEKSCVGDADQDREHETRGQSARSPRDEAPRIDDAARRIFWPSR
jgi:hypothetical protein